MYKQIMIMLAVVAVSVGIAHGDEVELLRRTSKAFTSVAKKAIPGVVYVEVEKTFVDRRPKTLLSLTSAGREAFEAYRRHMRQVLEGPSGPR